MKRIDIQKEIGAAAKRIATRPSLSVTAGPTCFVNGSPFNVMGAVLAEAHKAVPDARIFLPRKMNSLDSAHTLAIALGVDETDISSELQSLLDKLQTVDSLNDHSRQLLKDLSVQMNTLVGRSPGRPKLDKATSAA